MHEHRDLSDLWHLIIKGDDTAFRQLFELQYAELQLFGLRVYFDQGLVKDCIQDVFLELWNKRKDLPEVQNIPAYLKQILKRKLFKVLKDKERKGQIVQDKNHYTDSYETHLILQQDNEEQKQKLKSAFAQLTTKQKEIIQLRFFHGLSYDEIAERTNAQKRTIYNQIHTALKVLKKSMLIQLLFLLH